MQSQNQNARKKTLVVTPQTNTLQLFVGPQPRGPRRCIKCGKEFKNGQVWRRLTAPDDPQHGTYSIGIHEACAQK